MMMLRKIISGGQTGADRTGLECARKLGLETGGTAPRDWRTENGPDPSLEKFGLTQSSSSSYPPRTRANVRNSDATVWFGTVGSPGYWCTIGASGNSGLPFYQNPTPSEFKKLADRFAVINIAGNRASKNPRVIGIVRVAFAALEPTIEERKVKMTTR